MFFKIESLANSLTFFQKNLKFPTELQKKILMVAIIAFAIFAACYYLGKKCCFKIDAKNSSDESPARSEIPASAQSQTVVNHSARIAQPSLIDPEISEKIDSNRERSFSTKSDPSSVNNITAIKNKSSIEKERIFIPFITSSSLPCLNLLDLDGWINPSCFYEEMTKNIKEKIEKKKFFQVGYSLEECKCIINQHSWYKYNINDAYIIEIEIDKTAIGPSLSEQDFCGPNALSARADKYPILNKEQLDSFNIVNIHKHDYTRHFQIRMKNCYAVANSATLNTIQHEAGGLKVYFYKEYDDIMVHIFWSNEGEETLNLSQLLPGNPRLKSLNFPQTGIDSNVDNNFERLVKEGYEKKLNIFLSLIQLHAALQELKKQYMQNSEDSIKLQQVLEKIMEEIREAREKDPSLAAKMEKQVYFALCSINEREAMLLFQGQLDPQSPFSELPQELILFFISTGFALNEQYAKQP